MNLLLPFFSNPPFISELSLILHGIALQLQILEHSSHDQVRGRTGYLLNEIPERRKKEPMPYASPLLTSL